MSREACCRSIGRCAEREAASDFSVEGLRAVLDARGALTLARRDNSASQESGAVDLF